MEHPENNREYKGLVVNAGIEQPSSVNPYLKRKPKKRQLSVAEYVEGIVKGDITTLSRAVTLVESVKPEHQTIAQEVIEKCLPYSGNSIRIGISGVPGAGKSTSIDVFGLHVLEKYDGKLAVLAIDPSSERSKGSILGDKTRMEKLSVHPKSFIRPSPSAGSLGGVARKTRETIVLCEAAGFDKIFVETVGVGQSETAAVKNTAVILVVSIFFNVLLGSVTAYCLQRFEFRFRRLVMGCFYLGMLVPTFVVEIARFKVIQSMGLYNTLGAPIIIYVASDLMQLYLYMQFVSKIPKALDESALIDGCGYFRIFYSIIFPLLAPATATVVILKIVNIVNDMYVPYLYMPKTKLKTLTTFLMNYAGAQQGSWPTLAAAIIVVLIPTVVLYLIFHKQITEGLSAGATKE